MSLHWMVCAVGQQYWLLFIMQFYTWMRKNIPLQFKTLISDPRIFARLNDVQNAIAGGPIDWDEKPDYIQDMMAIQPMGSDKYFSNTLP